MGQNNTKKSNHQYVCPFFSHRLSALPRFIKRVHSSQSPILNLSNRAISVKNLFQLSIFFTTSTHSITHLNLTKSSIDDEGAKILTSLLSQHNVLIKECIFNDNQIGDISAVHFSQMLRINTTLVHLSLSNNQFGKKGIKAICKGMKENTTLRILLLGGNVIQDKGAEYLCGMLLKNTSLVQLDLHSCFITSTGITAIHEALLINSTLHTLNLAENKQSASILGKMICENTTLISLNISDIGFSVEDVKTISKAISSNTTLETLVLSNNSIPLSCEKVLCDAFLKNTCITSLDISMNLSNIGNQTGDGISALIESNTSLIILNISGCHIGKKCDKICAAVGKNTSLFSLDLKYNWDWRFDLMKPNTTLAWLESAFGGYEEADHLEWESTDFVRKNLKIWKEKIKLSIFTHILCRLLVGGWDMPLEIIYHILRFILLGNLKEETIKKLWHFSTDKRTLGETKHDFLVAVFGRGIEIVLRQMNSMHPIWELSIKACI